MGWNETFDEATGRRYRGVPPHAQRKIQDNYSIYESERAQVFEVLRQTVYDRRYLRFGSVAGRTEGFVLSPVGADARAVRVFYNFGHAMDDYAEQHDAVMRTIEQALRDNGYHTVHVPNKTVWALIVKKMQ